MEMGLAASIFLAGILQPVPGALEASAEAVHGMTISCQTWGKEWASPQLASELDTLQSLGIDWIAIHPYASIRADGQVVPWDLVPGQGVPEWLRHPIREAHRRGLKVMVKPHLAYWGSPFRWRGEIDFVDPTRFFRSYEAWIVQLAALSAGADAFVVGTELDRLTHHEGAWRRIIAKIRNAFANHLTYAANWPEVTSVPFWDALDAIGVQAYYPLASESPPTEAALRAGWEPHLQALRSLHRESGKPVVFTELGYDASPAAARAPWQGIAPHERTKLGEDVQARLYRVALELLESERTWLRGAFLWKWFIGPAPGEDFSLGKPARRALEAHWAEPRPSSPKRGEDSAPPHRMRREAR